MTDLAIQQASIKKLEAENKSLTLKVNRLNKKLAEHYKTINDLLEESNDLISDIKTNRNETDKEIDRLMKIIERNELCAESE